MRKRIVWLISVLFVLSMLMLGCQQAAQRPYNTNDNNNQTANEMTENERRVLAGRLSNLAEEVDGVKEASVIVADVGITQNNSTTDTMPNNTTNNNTNTNTNTRRTNMSDNNTGTTNTNTPGASDRILPPDNNNNNADTNPNTRTGINTNNVSPNNLIVMVGITMEDNNKNNDAANMKTTKQTVANRLKQSDSRISQVLVTGDPGMIKRINDVAAGLLEGKPINNFTDDIRNLGRDLEKEMPGF